MSITNPFGPDTPNTPDSERIDSALDNFIKLFFGTVTKSTDADGNVIWTLPAPLDNPEPVPGYSVDWEGGEGLAGYLARVLTDGVNAVAGKNGYATTVRSYHDTTQGPVGEPGARSFDVDDASLFSVGQIVYIPGGGYYQVFGVVHEVGQTEAVSLTNLYASTDELHPGQLAAGSFFPNQLLKIIPAAPVGATGEKGDVGETGPGATVLVDDVTLEAYTESNVDKIRAKAGGIDRSKLKETGTDGVNELGIVRVDGGLEFSNDAGASGGLAVKVSGADSALEVTANGLRVADEAITLEKLEDDARTGRAFYGVEDNSSAANAYVVTLSNPPASLQAGTVLNFVAQARNTGNTTLQISGIGTAKSVYRKGAELLKGDIPGSGAVVSVVYNGAQWELQSPTEGGANRWMEYTLGMPGAGAALTHGHGFTTVPQEVRAVLVCVVADTGGTNYAVNDEVAISGAIDGSAATNALAFAVFADGTNVGVARSAAAAAFRLIPKGGGNAVAVNSASNFTVKVYARKYLAN